jgi:hypothetical protein
MSEIIPPENGAPKNVVSAAPVPLTVNYIPRSLTMIHVSSSDLETLSSSGNSIHLTLFGVCFGAATSFGGVLATTVVANPLVFGAYVGLCCGSSILSVYFGLRGISDYRAAKRKLGELKSGK